MGAFSSEGMAGAAELAARRTSLRGGFFMARPLAPTLLVGSSDAEFSGFRLKDQCAAARIRYTSSASEKSAVVPCAAQHEVVRCRHGTSARGVEVPGQRCTAARCIAPGTTVSLTAN